MWRFLLTGVLILPLVACRPPETGGFPPFLPDDYNRTGPSSCTWHHRSINLPDIGTISFTYENCGSNYINDDNYFVDGNWIHFGYFEGSHRYNVYRAIGIFPLKGRDAETILREDVFSEELENPSCTLANTTRNSLERLNQDPLPDHFPKRWQLNSTDEIWDGRGDTPELFEDVCGPLAQNNVSPYGNLKGGYISEKYDHIFVLRNDNLSFEIDFFTVRFEPMRK